MNKSDDTLTPRIYIASLADYNAGRLHGKWIDCDQDVDDIREEIAGILKASKEPIAEEWAIHDYEGFGGLRLGEYEDIDRIAELAELIGEHRELITHIVDYCGGLDQIDEARRKMAEDYLGEWDSLEEWAEDHLDSCGFLEKVPQEIRNYIDFKKYAEDCELDGGIFVIRIDGKAYVFWTY
jgi:antirestriction protein